MLLALLLGFLGIDQWYAHHWILATFKLLFFLSAVALSFMGAKGSVALVSLLASIWCVVDVILWMVGGVYGTPGCVGGYHGPGGN